MTSSSAVSYGKPRLRLHFGHPDNYPSPRGWWVSHAGKRTLMFDNAAAPIRVAGRPGGFFVEFRR